MKNTTEKLEEYGLKKRQLEQEQTRKMIFADHLLFNWRQIDPAKINDSEFIDIQRSTPPFENWWNYEGRSNIYGVRGYFDITYVGKNKETSLAIAQNFYDKFHKRTMNKEEYNYFENNSERNIIKDIKKGRIYDKIEKLEKELK